MTWTKELIQEKLQTSTVMVERSLLLLYSAQTPDEQRASTTRENNGIGFNGVDAYILCEFAKWVKRSNRPEGERLSPKQLEIARKKLRKYATQLLSFVS